MHFYMTSWLKLTLAQIIFQLNSFWWILEPYYIAPESTTNFSMQSVWVSRLKASKNQHSEKNLTILFSHFMSKGWNLKNKKIAIFLYRYPVKPIKFFSKEKNCHELAFLSTSKASALNMTFVTFFELETDFYFIFLRNRDRNGVFPLLITFFKPFFSGKSYWKKTTSPEKRGKNS